MLTRRFALLWLFVAVIMALFAYTEAEATFPPPPPQLCDAEDGAAFRCAQLGNAKLEIVPEAGVWPIPATCGVDPCSRYPYLMSGATSNNQVSILIPVTVTILTGCTNVYGPGVGDPNGFGLGLTEFRTCRISPIHSSATPFEIKTSLASSDKTNALRKAGSQKFGDLILGPALGEPIRTSTVTTTDGEGRTLTVTTGPQGDFVNAQTSSPGGFQVFNLNELFLCVPSAPGASDALSRCLPLAFGTNLADLKTDGSDPCKVIKGRAVCY